MADTPFKEVATISEFFSAIEDVWESWTKVRAGTLAEIWFRGQADASFPLLPSALRPPFNSFSEHRLRHDFFLKAQPFVSELVAPPKDKWDWYFLMQHYGVPTRLLDWTESALVALYFALLTPRSRQDDNDACIWLLDPRKLNATLTKIGEFIPIYSDPSVECYLPALWDESSNLLPKFPVAIDPPDNSPRLAAQRGKFTVHGRIRRGLDTHTTLGNSLVKLIIPLSRKSAFRRQFLLTGITEGTLFPSLSGVAGEISTTYSRLW